MIFCYRGFIKVELKVWNDKKKLIEQAVYKQNDTQQLVTSPYLWSELPIFKLYKNYKTNL